MLVDCGVIEGLGMDAGPDPGNQVLFCAEAGLPGCQGWAWGLAEDDEEEEGAFVLKADPEKLLLEEPSTDIKVFKSKCFLLGANIIQLLPCKLEPRFPKSAKGSKV